MKRLLQRSLHCRCGRTKIVARGLCGVCYTLRWQDGRYFGGLREAVLARDGRRCRVCHNLERGKRTLAVYHRVPGRSDLRLMLALCPGCHAKVTRTAVLRADWHALLRTLWREQHPQAHEQFPLDFTQRSAADEPAPLFLEQHGD